MRVWEFWDIFLGLTQALAYWLQATNIIVLTQVARLFSDWGILHRIAWDYVYTMIFIQTLILWFSLFFCFKGCWLCSVYSAIFANSYLVGSIHRRLYYDYKLTTIVDGRYLIPIPFYSSTVEYVEHSLLFVLDSTMSC